MDGWMDGYDQSVGPALSALVLKHVIRVWSLSWLAGCINDAVVDCVRLHRMPSARSEAQNLVTPLAI